MVLIANKLGETGNEEAVHVVPWVGHQLTQRPEGVLLGVEVHQQQGRDLGHALAVADLQHKGGQLPVKQKYLKRNEQLTV